VPVEEVGGLTEAHRVQRKIQVRRTQSSDWKHSNRCGSTEQQRRGMRLKYAEITGSKYPEAGVCPLFGFLCPLIGRSRMPYTFVNCIIDIGHKNPG
jgi:hypothetical protein